MHPLKIVLLVVWVACSAAFFVDSPATLARAGRATFVLMALAHAVEFAVFRERFQRAGGSLGRHFLQTLIFGFLHIREVRAPQSAEGSH